MEQQQGRANRLAAFAGQLGGKLGVAICLAGFVVIFLGWNGAASFNDLRQQFPWLISGGIAGLGLVALGAALLVIESMRAERAELQSSIEDLRRAIEGLGAGSGNGHTMASTTVGAADLVVTGSTSYHRPDCRLVAGREQPTLLPKEAADEQGLTPCRICKPSEQQASGRLRAR